MEQIVAPVSKWAGDYADTTSPLWMLAVGVVIAYGLFKVMEIFFLYRNSNSKHKE